MPTNLNLVGTAGEYHVCAQLCQRGHLALLTPKNNPVFDVIATNHDGTKTVAVQVKTRSADNNQGWKLGTDITDAPTAAPGTFVALVKLRKDELPEFYIYTRAELARRVGKIYDDYMAKPKRDGTERKDVSFRWFDEISFDATDHARKNHWDLIEAALSGA